LEVLEYFSDRMNTFTVKTPNGGYHAYFIVKHPETYVKYKKSLKVEILSNYNTIVFGEAETVTGKIGNYVPVNKEPIKTDDTIINDIKTFLRETLTKYSFLNYKCVAKKLGEKINHLTHEQRLNISNLFLQNQASVTTTKNFFRMCNDFDAKTSHYQIKKTKEKIEAGDLKYPTCKTLSKDFDFDRKDCNGCIRVIKNNKKSTKNKLITFASITLKDILHENINSKPLLYSGVGHDPDIGLFYGTTSPKASNFVVIIGINSGYLGIKESGLQGEKLPSDKYLCKDLSKLLNDKTCSAIFGLLNEVDKNSKFEYKSISTLFDNIVNIMQDYLDLQNEVEYYVLALWIISTYFRPIFMWQGYMVFFGMRDVGKSTALLLLSHTCFNGSGTISGNKSESNLMRLAGGTHGLIIVDHYEEVKKNPIKNQTYVEFLESAWFKNATYERQSTDDHNKEQVFNISSSVVVGTRSLNDTLHEKGIIITMVESTNPKYQDKSAKIDDDPIFENIQRNFIAMALNYQNHVKEAYDTLKVVSGLGREFNKFRGLFALAKVIDAERKDKDNFYDKILLFAKAQRSNRKTESNETEDALLRAIVEGNKITWTYPELSLAVVEQGFEFYKWQSARSDLDKLQVTRKRDTNKHPVVITLDLDRAKERAIQRGVNLD
jgi:hypothetical protein